MLSKTTTKRITTLVTTFVLAVSGLSGVIAPLFASSAFADSDAGGFIPSLQFKQGASGIACGVTQSSTSNLKLYWFTNADSSSYDKVKVESNTPSGPVYTVLAMVNPTPNSVGISNFGNDGNGAYNYRVSILKYHNGQLEVKGSNTCALNYVSPDNIKPVVSGSRTPLSNAYGWNNANVTVNFTCTDNIGVATNDVVTPVLVSTEGANQSVTSTGACKDAANNASLPATVSNINIDKTLPVIHYATTPTGPTNTSVNVTFTCEDALSGVDPLLTTLTTSKVVLSNATVSSTGDCYDKAGNKANAVSVVVSNIDKDIPPTPEITFPTNSNNYFNYSPISNQWTGVSDPSGISKYQVAYNYDDGHSFSGSTCSGITFSGYSGFVGCRDTTSTQRDHQPTLQEQGGVTVWVRAEDNAGNWSLWSAPVHYYYDATAPTVPTNGQPSNVYKNTNIFSYTWDASTDNLGPVHYEYLASKDPTTVGGMLVNNVWSPASGSDQEAALMAGPSIPSEGTSDGTWYWQVRAVDAAGNASAWSQVWSYTLDTVAPKATVSDLVTTNTKPTITGTVDDPNADVSVNVNGVNYTAKVDTVPNSNGTYDWSAVIANALALDTYNISATATDMAGNLSTTTGELTVFAVPVPPIQPVQLLLGPTTTPLFTPTPRNTSNTNPGDSGSPTDQSVAGAQTQAGDNQNGNKDQAVEGASDTKGPWTLWGVAWYWWLIILAVLGAIVWWLIAGYRRRSDEEA